jgi:hypothetical protein
MARIHKRQAEDIVPFLIRQAGLKSNAESYAWLLGES